VKGLLPTQPRLRTVPSTRTLATGTKLFEANGVAVGVEPTLSAADHGEPAVAAAAGEAGTATRQF